MFHQDLVRRLPISRFENHGTDGERSDVTVGMRNAESLISRTLHTGIMNRDRVSAAARILRTRAVITD